MSRPEKPVAKFLAGVEYKGVQEEVADEQCSFVSQSTGVRCVLRPKHVGPHSCPTDDGGQS